METPQPFTLIDADGPHRLLAHVEGGAVRVSTGDVRSALGWEWKPQGLCRGERCIPIAPRTGLIDERGIDLATLAGVLDQPLALDVDEAVAYLGASAADRSARLASLDAPDFTLPDLHGVPHSLSDYRGKKVLLVCYASW